MINSNERIQDIALYLSNKYSYSRLFEALYYSRIIKNLQKISPISMLVLTLLPTILQPSLVIDFVINQEKYTDLFCINKEEPIRVCKAKCYLNNKVLKLFNEAKQNDHQDSSTLPTTVDAFHGLLSFFFFEKISTPYFRLNLNLFSTFFENLKSQTFQLVIFHPPIV